MRHDNTKIFISNFHIVSGSTKIWYGIPDVVLLPDSVLMVEPATKNIKKKYKLKDEEKLSEICEEKKHTRSLNSKQVTSQIISQTVTFSLYISNLKIRKPELKIPDISLIPTFIINPTSLHIFMYDYRHDVLLCSDNPPLELWDESGFHFKKSTVFYIWMILNHMVCMPKFQSFQTECLQNSSNFHSLCELYGLQPSKISHDILFGNSFPPHKNVKKRKRYYLNHQN